MNPFRFDQYPPPRLTEEDLRREQNRRTLRVQIALLGSAFLLIQVLLLVLGVRFIRSVPLLSLFCFGAALMTLAEGFLVAVLLVQKRRQFRCST